jgi:hypothetical protein
MENKYTQLIKFAELVFQHNQIPTPKFFEFKIGKGVPQFVTYPTVMPKRYVDWASHEVIRLTQENVLAALQGDEIDHVLLDAVGVKLRAEAALIAENHKVKY